MNFKKAVQVGNKVIRAKALPVLNVKSKTTRRIVQDLTDSMRYCGLVGMAGPQIGKGLRIFVTEIRKTKTRKDQKMRDIDPLRIFINPRIMSVSKKEIRGWEGCGSVAHGGLFGMVRRPASVVVEAYDENGDKFIIKTSNLLARVIQHEMDHLNGIVFVDKADPKTYMSRDEYLKFRAKGN